MKQPRHPKSDHVISTLAVFLALAGGSMAIADVPDDSVDSGKVIDETLKSRDLRDGEAVRSSDVVDEEIAARDIADGGVTANDLAADAVGAAEIATDAVGADEVALDSISSSEISPSAVGSTEIVDGSITGSDVADGEIDADEIGAGNFHKVQGEGIEWEDPDAARNGDYGLRDNAVSCNTRFSDGELIGGGVNWENVDDSGNEQLISELRLNMSTDTVTVLGGNDTGAFRTMNAVGSCLSR